MRRVLNIPVRGPYACSHHYERTARLISLSQGAHHVTFAIDDEKQLGTFLPLVRRYEE